MFHICWIEISNKNGKPKLAIFPDLHSQGIYTCNQYG